MCCQVVRSEEDLELVSTFSTSMSWKATGFEAVVKEKEKNEDEENINNRLVEQTLHVHDIPKVSIKCRPLQYPVLLILECR